MSKSIGEYQSILKRLDLPFGWKAEIRKKVVECKSLGCWRTVDNYEIVVRKLTAKESDEWLKNLRR